MIEALRGWLLRKPGTTSTDLQALELALGTAAFLAEGDAVIAFAGQHYRVTADIKVEPWTPPAEPEPEEEPAKHVLAGWVTSYTMRINVVLPGWITFSAPYLLGAAQIERMGRALFREGGYWVNEQDAYCQDWAVEEVQDASEKTMPFPPSLSTAHPTGDGWTGPPSE